MGASQGPAHPLLFHEPAADDLVDGRFDERRADRFPLPSSFAKVRDEFADVADISTLSQLIVVYGLSMLLGVTLNCSPLALVNPTDLHVPLPVSQDTPARPL